MTNTHKEDDSQEKKLFEEARCLRCVLERILRVMDEGLFVDYQMEKFGKKYSQSNLNGVTSSHEQLHKEERKFSVRSDKLSNPDDSFKDGRDLKDNEINSSKSGRDTLIHHYSVTNCFNGVDCGEYKVSNSNDWSLVSCPDCLKHRGRK